MKLPQSLTQFLGKKEEEKNFFFSLYLDMDAAAASAWYVAENGAPKTVSFAHASLANDTWEDRIQVVDRLLSAVEDKAGVEKAISKTVIGVPGVYLTPDGNIAPGIRPQLKKLTTMLDLTAVGFVPIAHAVEYSLKKSEGIPPSVILIGNSGAKATFTMYRVGKVSGEQIVDMHDDPALAIETVLKSYQEGDVLPSRMLLYGGDETKLEAVRAKLLKHPWSTRANFLHFPKIEILTTEKMLESVSLSGASELASTITETEEGDISAGATSVVAQPVRNPEASVMPQSTEDEDALEDDALEDDEDEAEDEVDEPEDEQESVIQAKPIDEKKAPEKFGAVDEDEFEEESNVHVVTPEALGFSGGEITTKPVAKAAVAKAESEQLEEELDDEEEGDVEDIPQKPRKKMAAGMAFKLPKINTDFIGRWFKKLPRRGGWQIPALVGVLVLAILGGAIYYFAPHVAVTVLVAPFSLSESTTLTVDPAATIADPATKIIPGRTQEKSVTGEKTVSATGKKKVGDPARGTVTIYNKVTSERTFKKGTVLTAKGLSFTLDEDVSVASASETIGSITFGKKDVAVTASEIGTASNVPAATEFTFKDTSSSVVYARNDAAFTGGVSRDVTVVSRADYDGIVKALTGELVAKAKADLSAQIGAERLIDQTVKTEVSEKIFDAELDEEAKQVQGKVTITVSGQSIRDEDIKAILTSLVAAKVPNGYSLSGGQTDVKTTGVTVKKDGKITLTATLAAVALPVVDTHGLAEKLAGKKVDEASSILKSGNGVAAAEYRFSLSPSQSRLPINPKNISISVAVSP